MCAFQEKATRARAVPISTLDLWREPPKIGHIQSHVDKRDHLILGSKLVSEDGFKSRLRHPLQLVAVVTPTTTPAAAGLGGRTVGQRRSPAQVSPRVVVTPLVPVFFDADSCLVIFSPFFPQHVSARPISRFSSRVGLVAVPVLTIDAADITAGATATATAAALAAPDVFGAAAAAPVPHATSIATAALRHTLRAATADAASPPAASYASDASFPVTVAVAAAAALKVLGDVDGHATNVDERDAVDVKPGHEAHGLEA